jgi:uncharacterized membrane protein YuzA (DUF378 family)
MMTPKQAFSDHPFKMIASILVIIGALNWLAIGVSNTNVVEAIFSSWSKMIYIIVGIAALYLAFCKIMWLSGKPLHSM